MDSLDIVFGFTSIVYSILTILTLALVIIGCILMACINSIFKLFIEMIIELVRSNFNVITIGLIVFASIKYIASAIHRASYNSQFNSLLIRLSIMVG